VLFDRLRDHGRLSISASGRPFASSGARMRSDARCSNPSSRSGTATRCGFILAGGAAFCGVATPVCGLVLGPVPRHVRGCCSRSSCGPWGSCTATRSPIRAGANGLGLGLARRRRRPGAAVRRGLSENLFLGLPFHFDELQRPVLHGRIPSACCTPSPCWPGVVQPLNAHHATARVYAALKVGEPMSGGAPRPVGRAGPALCTRISFIAAGMWVATTMGGSIGSCRKSTRSDRPNPLTKHVAVIQGAWLGKFPGARELVAGARDRAARGRG